MQQEHQLSSKALRLFFLLLIPLTALLMGFFDSVDQQWTGYLREFSGYSWVKWMDQSLFEGGFLGAGDITLAVYFGVICLFFYQLVSSRIKPNKNRDHPASAKVLGQILTAGLLVVILTHGLKWLMGRPRPGDFFGGSCDFKNWFEIASDGLCSRRYRGGSFPSGHTSNAASLIFPMAAWAKSQRNRREQFLIWGCSGVLIYALIMGLARIMHGDHWITDIWGAFCINLYVFIVLWKPWDLMDVSQDGV